MPILDVPPGTELDDYDTDCTWAELVVKQVSIGPISKSTIVFGDCIAFMGNTFYDEPHRRVFIIVVDEDHVLVFDENGSRVDEPDQFVVDGRQNLHGDTGFLSDWDQGFYTVPDPTSTADLETPETSMKSRLVPGTRIQECFKMNADDENGKWYGGIMGEGLPDGRFVFGFDDGDLAILPPEELQGLLDMEKLSACTLNGMGVVADVPQELKAAEICTMKCGNVTCPVGVLLKDNLPAHEVVGAPVYHSHILNVQSIDQVLQSRNSSRPTRSAANAATQINLAFERAGYHSIRRGDMLQYTGTCSGTPPEEIAFGVLVFQHRNQQNRYIISFDPTTENFSVGTWTSWTRMPAVATEPNFDPDSSAVHVAPQLDYDLMCKSWAADTHVCTLDSKDKLKKLSQLGPSQLRHEREESARKKARERKQAAAAAKAAATEKAAQVAAAKATAAKTAEAAKAAEAVKAAKAPKGAEAAKAAEAAEAAAAGRAAARLAREVCVSPCVSPASPPKRKNTSFEATPEMRARIEREERARHEKEERMRLEFRQTLVATTPAASSSSVLGAVSWIDPGMEARYGCSPASFAREVRALKKEHYVLSREMREVCDQVARQRMARDIAIIEVRLLERGVEF